MKRSTKRRLFVAALVAISVGVIVAISIIRPDWFLLVFLAAGLVLFIGFMGLSSSLLRLIEWVIWPRGVRGVDARGNEIELPDIKKMPSGDQITRQWRAKAKNRPVVSHRTTKILVFWWVGLICFFGVVALMILGVKFPTWANSVFILIVVPLTIVWSRIFIVICLRWQCAWIVANGRCGCCGYDLAKLPVAEDGCTVCPECGAAWQLHLCSGCGHYLGRDDSQECPECGWKRDDQHNACGYSSAAGSN